MVATVLRSVEAVCFADATTGVVVVSALLSASVEAVFSDELSVVDFLSSLSDVSEFDSYSVDTSVMVSAVASVFAVVLPHAVTDAIKREVVNNNASGLDFVFLNFFIYDSSHESLLLYYFYVVTICIILNILVIVNG